MKRLKNHAEVEEKIEEETSRKIMRRRNGARRDEVLEEKAEVSNRAVSCLEK